MMRIVDRRQRVGRCLVSCFGLAAAVLMLSAAPGERAQAMSLINAAAAPSAKHAADALMIEVRGHGGGGGGGGHHGGGGRGAAHFGGGGGHHAAPAFRAGPAFHAGHAYRAGPVYRGGGVRYGAYRHGGFRFAHRHHHRRFFYGSYYDYPSYYYYPRHRCGVIRTHHGPRRICRWHHRHRWHHWRVY